ncbi:MAG TPA: family 16 glycoside hydrolase, partial [Candidatus Sulfopaludibacter sp.]|nr:family 16 glycoside hydrolase [Candidatus Sulfopaludibacter sp.]
MPKLDLSRRAFVASLAAAPLASGADDWVELFNGRTMEGWTPSEHKDSWKVSDGALVADGGRSHLFYTGSMHGASFKNFELEVDCLARPA